MAEGKSAAAEQRAGRVAWLQEERRKQQARGLDYRVRQIDAELEQLQREPKGRKKPDSTTEG